ncbi:S41 family peptidase [Magnetospira sp. QH-2]|uniref:S41 family peptidase n=1 Tax=Magnetospira sp. (strain QH-2) TaxID=1288970 RepID=UPI0003E81C1B|nr:S41 family peptidase [Magnetospira sp. QH-2]CCQ75161.1 putative C-terminal processing peptidase [Magnetospira sp. QH-2]
MTFRIAAAIVHTLFCLGFFVAGCAPVPTTTTPSATTPVATSVASLAPLPRPAMTHTLTTGYEAITDKFIQPVSVARLALDGLQGLGAIDPALVARADDKQLEIRVGAVKLASLAVPEEGDVGAWARLSIDAIDAARHGSPALRKADSETVYEALFDSALSQLDVYSRYAGAEQARKQRARREGFGGIGIRYRAAASRVRITEVLPDTPAHVAGITKNSLITQIDGAGTAKLNRIQIQNLLRGPINSRVTLRILPANEHKAVTFDLVRRRIVPASVFDKGTKDGIVVLRISSFNQHTSRNLAKAIKEKKDQLGSTFRGLIIDLRGNPGGLLRQAIDVVDLFLDQGAIVRTRGRHDDSFQSYEAESGDILNGLPLVLVVDGKSASAAEIVAAALQDHGRAAVIGTSSYGKGTVQTVIRLPNDGEMTLTWSRFISPSGYVLHGLGVRPVLCTSRNTSWSDKTDADLSDMVDRGRAALTAWRTAPSDDNVQRGALRDACPAERRRHNSDLVLARRVVSDTPLYAHMITPKATASVAEHRPESN